MKNLKAELARNGLSYGEVSKAVGINIKTFYRKMSGEQEFKLSEMKKIKDTYFPFLTLDYLFE